MNGGNCFLSFEYAVFAYKISFLLILIYSIIQANNSLTFSSTKTSFFSKNLYYLARYGAKITRQSIEKGAFTLKKQQFPSLVRDAIE